MDGSNDAFTDEFANKLLNRNKREVFGGLQFDAVFSCCFDHQVHQSERRCEGRLNVMVDAAT